MGPAFERVEFGRLGFAVQGFGVRTLNVFLGMVTPLICFRRSHPECLSMWKEVMQIWIGLKSTRVYPTPEKKSLYHQEFEFSSLGPSRVRLRS